MEKEIIGKLKQMRIKKNSKSWQEYNRVKQIFTQLNIFDKYGYELCIKVIKAYIKV